MVDTTGLSDVFVLDPRAWSPRPAVYRIVVEWARCHSARVPTSREVFAALRNRGFREVKRRGRVGFLGIYTVPELAAAPALSRVAGTATAYKQGDRSDASREALGIDRALRTLARRGGIERASSGLVDPFAAAAHASAASVPAEFPASAASAESLPDGYMRSTRVTRVLVARAEERWGAAPSWLCVYCGAPASTVDHFYPWRVTHDSSPSNLVPCCPRCQASKGASHPLEWMARHGVSADRQAAILAPRLPLD